MWEKKGLFVHGKDYSRQGNVPLAFIVEIFWSGTYCLGRNTSDNGVGRYIICHNSTCTNHSATSDGYALQDGGSNTNPDIVLDDNRLEGALEVPGLVVVTTGHDVHAMRDGDARTDSDASTAIEDTLRVDVAVLTN